MKYGINEGCKTQCVLSLGSGTSMQYVGKIFGIGFHKTGTTSLTLALQQLGYKAIHGDGYGTWSHADEGRTLLKFIERGDYRLPTFKLFDAFLDNPYFSIWPHLYRLYPEAKFILTVREERDWIESCTKYFADRRVRPMQQWKFGDSANPSKSESARQKWIQLYRQHNSSIMQHFDGLDHQFLVMDIAQGDGWDKLWKFLEARIPHKHFPRANRRKRWNLRSLLRRVARNSKQR